jgi:type II secretory ATPase GspE/PulE/Tfp pilus assembly ATPase PilB-like protein/GAF domain-containing protein
MIHTGEQMREDLQNVLFKKDNQEFVEVIGQQVRASQDIKEFFPDLIEELKLHFDCEAITVFAVDQSTHQLYSTNYISDNISEIRLNISLKNLPGFVAGTGNSLNIYDVKDPVELAQYHPQLSHDSSWDDKLNFNTKSIIVVPLPFNRNLIGILEIINKRNGGHFSLDEFQLAKNISSALGLALARLNSETNNQQESNPGGTVSDSPDCETDDPETTQHDDLASIPSVVTAIKKQPDEIFSDEPEASYNHEDRYEEDGFQSTLDVDTALQEQPDETASDEPVVSSDHEDRYEEDGFQSTQDIVPTIQEQPDETASDESVVSNDPEDRYEEDGFQSTQDVDTALQEQPDETSSDEPEASNDPEDRYEEDGFQSTQDVDTALQEQPDEPASDEPVASNDHEDRYEDDVFQSTQDVDTALQEQPDETASDESEASNDPEDRYEDDGFQSTQDVVTALQEQPDETSSDESEASNDPEDRYEDDGFQSTQSVVTAIQKQPDDTSSDELVCEADDNKYFNKEECQKLLDTVKTAKNLDKILCEFQEPILNLIGAENFILHKVNPEKNELYQTFNTGDQNPKNPLPISPSSIAGYVARDKKPVNIANVNAPDELSQCHPDLIFDAAWNQQFGYKITEVLAVPLIHNENLLGVLQLVNKSCNSPFTENDLKFATLLAENMAFAYSNQEEPVPDEQTKFSYLLKNNLISEKALKSSVAHAESNQLELEFVLLQQVKIKREDLGLSLANFYNLPYYGYRNSIVLPQKIIGGLNKNFLAKNFWIPIKSDDSKVVILINDPTSPHKLQNIKHIFSRKEVEFKIGLKVDIIDFLNSILEQGEAHFEGMQTEKMSSLISNLQEKTKDDLLVPEEKDESEEIQSVNEKDSAIIQLVNKILVDAYDRKVSDIHIEPGVGKENVLVRFRKEGECNTYEEIPAIYKQGIISRLKIMAQMDIAEKRLPQDGKFKARYGNKQVEFRVATCPTVGGNEDAVLRILAQGKMSPLEEMNFTAQNLDIIKKTLTKPYGLVLVVGPTGSGKTTTLHSCLNFINTPKKKIWTAEDPVEITQKGLRQVQMLEKKGLNFARAMRSFLRGDPDVIMVGEIRDEETANMSLQASLTGHLVFSTLHTNSAPETITRLLDMGMNPLNFADSLLLIIAQRLVKTLCKECCEDYHPSIEEFEILVNEYGQESFEQLKIEYNSDFTLKKPVGCHACDDTGYAGRTAIHELLQGTQGINRLIIKQESVEQLRNKAMEEGMRTLKQDGIQKVLNGDCDLKQVLSVCII